MYIDFDGMQTKELPNFKGGEKTFRADMFDDGDTKIMRGRLESGASIGLHTHEGNCEIRKKNFPQALAIIVQRDIVTALLMTVKRILCFLQ